MARKDRLFRTTALVTMVIIVSKLCGFVRDMITANYFGTGIESDAYTASYSLFYLPIFLFNSCITSTLVPMFVQAKKDGGDAEANRFGSGAFNLFGLAAIVIAAIMFLFAGPIVKLLYIGYNAETLALTIKLTRIMLVSLVFNVTSIVMSSILNAKEKFIAGQLTGFPLSVASIIAAVFFSQKYGSTALAWGVFASGVLQVVVQLPFFFGWFRYSPNFDVTDPRFRKLMVLAGPAVLSMAVSELNHMIDHALASGLETGVVTALNYGYRLITFITGILVVPITTIVFSKFSKMAAGGDKDGMLAIIRRCVEVLALMIVPVIAVCAVMNKDVIRFAYGSGAFDEKSVMLTSGAFLFYVIGVLSFGLRDLMNRSFHAMQDTKTPFRVACVVVALNITLNFILRELMGANGLALATTVSGFCGMTIMFIVFRRRVGRLGFRKTFVDVAKILAGGAVCAAAAYGMDMLLPAASGRIQVFFRLAVTTVVAFGAYGITELVLRESLIGNTAGSIIKKITHRKGM